MKSGFPHIFSQTLHHNNNKNENEPKSPQHTTRLYTIITLTNSQVYRFLTNKMAIEIGLTFCYITTSPRRRPLLDRKMREFEPSSKSGLTQLIRSHEVKTYTTNAKIGALEWHVLPLISPRNSVFRIQRTVFICGSMI